MQWHKWMLGILICGASSSMLPSAFGETAPDARRSITVNGEAERRVVPDIARVNAAVEQRGLPLEVVRRQVNEATARVLKELKALRIAESDISSSGIVVRPEYSFDRAGVRRFEGYVVTRQIVVTLRDVSNLGALIERSLDAGANQISDPIFDHSDRIAIERSVMGAATLAARQNALAAAAGIQMTVGSARRISVAGPATTLPRANVMRMAVMDATAAESSYQTGDLLYKVTVEAEFDLLP